MKTQIITIFAALVLGSGISNKVNAATANNARYTIVNDISAISKIEVYGNVQLYVSDGPADQVKVYNKYYAESALLQSRNGVLRISSYKNEKLVVWVTTSDLRTISAYDNADVKSFGTLSKIEFNVELHNNASARLGLDAVNANILVADNAKAELSGNANKLNLSHSIGSTVNNYNFIAANYNESKISLPALKSEDLAGL